MKVFSKRSLPGFTLLSCLILAWTVLVACPCEAQLATPYIKTDGFSLSEPVSLSNLIRNQGKGDYVSGRHIWAWLWFEVGFKRGNLGFGFLQRYDYYGRFSEDTAEIVGLTVNKQDLPSGREFDLFFSGMAFHSKGVRLSYDLNPFPWLSVSAGASYLFSDMFMEGDLKGKATVLSDKDYDYEADVDYQYTEDVLFDRPVSPHTGHGYSIDLQTRLRLGDSWTMDLEIVDLLGRIYWKNLPRTDALATSDRKEYDEDGYVHIDPVLTGYEGYHNSYTQSLHPRSHLQIAYSFWNQTVLMDAHKQYDVLLWALGHRYTYSSGAMMMKYWPQHHALTLGFSKKHLAFEITADHVDVDKIHLFALTISIQTGGP